MINNKYKLIALILACLALLFFLIGIIWMGLSVGSVGSESVKITSDIKEIEVGWNYQLEVKKNINADHHLEYSSSDNEILTISDTGYMNAIKTGEVTITVSIKEKKSVKDSITIKVVEPEKKLVLSEKSIYLNPNEERKIYVYNTNPEGYLIWETNDEYVATVNDGVIKAINYGEAEITVKNEEDISAIIKVKVLSPEEEQTIELQNISFYEADVGLDVGEQFQLTVIFDPRNVKDKSLVWDSSNPDAVTVSSDGVLTAVGDGNATITATASNGLVAKCDTKSTTNVIPATGISLDNTEVKMYAGDAYTLKATITPTNTTSKNVTWTSSNTSVATVSRGVIIGIKEGTTTITASTNNGKTATAKVTVSKKIIEPYSVSIDKQAATISVDGKVTLVASITPYNATNKTITWTSSDTSVATVNNGVVTGRKAGTTTITAKTSNGKTATSKITVSAQAINVTGISLNTTNIKLNAGQSTTLKVTYTPNNATNQSVSWSSSNTGVATVNNTGVIRAVKGGTATITAKTSNGITATCTVEVEKADDVVTIRKRTASYSGNPISATISARSGSIKSTTYYSDSACRTKTNTTNANTEGGPPKESGIYYVIVETNGNSNYNGVTSKCTVAVEITKRKATITCSNKAYNGKQQVIATCTGGTISNEKQTSVGSYQIACKGTGAYSDATPKSCSITARSISSAMVSGLSDVVYTGHAITQTPIVKIVIDGETKTLVNNTDYTYTTKNNTYAGQASVVITGKCNYNGTKTAYFKILKEPATITCEDKVFNGTTQTIAKCTGGTATNATKKDVGSYQVGCTPDSSHSAPAAKTCKITPYNFTSLIVDPIPSKTYTGSPIPLTSITVKVSINGTTYGMTKDKDYTFTVKNNTNVGNAIVTITGKGNYNGIYSTSFAITKAQAVITCKSNVTYTGSSQTIATCNSTGGLSNAQQTNVGSYSVGCNGDSNYTNATPKTCSISKGTDKPTISLKTTTFNGFEVKAYVTAKTCSTSDCTVTYYVDSSCTRKTSSSYPAYATSTGSPPKGSRDASYTFYAIATSPGNDNYNGASSSCTKAIVINKVN